MSSASTSLRNMRPASFINTGRNSVKISAWLCIVLIFLILFGFCTVGQLASRVCDKEVQLSIAMSHLKQAERVRAGSAQTFPKHCCGPLLTILGGESCFPDG